MTVELATPERSSAPAPSQSAARHIPGPSLVKAITAVMADVSAMPKEGRNDFHGYDYIKASDVHDVLRSIMARHGLIAIPSVIEHATEEKTDKRGRVMWRTTLTLEVVWSTGEDSMTTRWVGVGEDAGDKSYYKAYTGALKYALLKTFSIGEGGADPEAPHPNETHEVASKTDLAARIVRLLIESVTKEECEELIRIASRGVSKGKSEKLEDLDEKNLLGLIRRLEGHDPTERGEYVRGVIEREGNGGSTR